VKNAGRSFILLGVAALLYAGAWFVGSAFFCADAFKAGAGPCFAQARDALLTEPHVIIITFFGVAVIIVGSLLSRKS
jgi:hypothetical protein